MNILSKNYKTWMLMVQNETPDQRTIRELMSLLGSIRYDIMESPYGHPTLSQIDKSIKDYKEKNSIVDSIGIWGYKYEEDQI